MNEQQMQSVIMAAEAHFQEMLREVELDFSTLPQMQAGLKVLWMRLPPGTKAALQQANPKGYQDLQEFLK